MALQPNRILAAFIQGQMEQEEAKQRQFQNKLRTQEDARQDQELKLREKQILQNIDLENKKFDIYNKSSALERQLNTINLKNMIGELLRSGRMKPTTYSPQAQEQLGTMNPDTGLYNEVSPDILEIAGQRFNVGEFGSARDVGQAQLEQQKPLLDYQGSLAQELARLRNTGQVNLETMRQAGRKQIADEANKTRRDIATNRDITSRGNARLRANAAQSNTENNKEDDKYLTPSETIQLNVPYGTLRKDAKGKTAQKPLSDTEQAKITEVDGLLAALDKVEDLGKKTGWKAHTKFATGNLAAKFENILGKETEDMATYRAEIGKVLGKEALLQGGKSFTKTEKELLLRYAPDLSDSPTRVRSKLKSLRAELTRLRSSTLNAPQIGGNEKKPPAGLGFEEVFNGKKVRWNPATGVYDEVP